MKTYLINRLFPVLAVAALLTISCSKNDDDDGAGAGSPANNILPNDEYFVVKQGNNSYAEGVTTIAIYEHDGARVLNVISQYSSQDAVAEIEFYPIPNPGVYNSSSTMGFGFVKGSDGWFCGEGCKITIITHDKTAKYLEGTVSGTMTTIFGETISNISCEFGVKY